MALRIAFVSHSFPPEGEPLSNIGGMQRVAVDLCAALSESDGVELTPIVLKTSWSHTGWRTPIFLAKLALTLANRLRRQPVDVVLFSSMVTATLSPLLQKQMGGARPKMAAIVHGLDLTTASAPWQLIVRKTLPRLDLLLPVSRATADAAIQRGMPADRIHVHPNGIDPSRFERLSEPAQLPPAIAGAEQLLLGVGRQVPRKGFLWFVQEVMPKLPDSFSLALAGTGPQHEALAQAIADLGLSERVHLLGAVDEPTLHALYARADLFIMPNRPIEGDMEGFGVVMLEAAAHGVMVVAAALEGILDVLSDGGGLLLETGDARAWVSALESLAAAPAEDKLKRKEEALELAARFLWPANAARLAALLRDSAGGDNV